MNTSYYEAVAEVPPDHCLRLQLPDEIPTGFVRVAVIFEAEAVKDTEGDAIKDILATMPDVGEDADFGRHRDLGRGEPGWDF
jgi:hypothetical protein